MVLATFGPFSIRMIVSVQAKPVFNRKLGLFLVRLRPGAKFSHRLKSEYLKGPHFSKKKPSKFEKFILSAPPTPLHLSMARARVKKSLIANLVKSVN